MSNGKLNEESVASSTSSEKHFTLVTDYAAVKSLFKDINFIFYSIAYSTIKTKMFNLSTIYSFY